ncbi:MAG: iron-containing alcohol dehydrogenase [Lentisphaerae bacterium]|nr:iron-containing alcohol dehydrogenase [Lentisphaerota bacterium]
MNPANYQLHYPAEIVFGCGTAKVLAEKLAPFKKVLLVAGTHFSRSAEFDTLLVSLKNFSVKTETGIHAEPPLADVDRVTASGRDFQAEAVVAIGGGSVIDCAKAAAALIPLSGSCAEYFSGSKTIPGKGLFFAALPTTAGTGAEITNNSVLTDPETKIKKSLRHPSMVADLAMVDPELTVSCPPALTAASGLDAFVQAFESYTSPKASAVTQSLSCAALVKFAANLEKACQDGSDLSVRTEMAEGSMMSAMAFSQTGLGAIHGLAHPIGSLLGVPHGKACAALIPAVVEWNLPACEKQYGEIAQRCGFGKNADDFLAVCLDLCKKTGVKAGFRDYGLNESHFDFIVKNCRSASMKLNPRPMTDDEVRNMLKGLV